MGEPERDGIDERSDSELDGGRGGGMSDVADVTTIFGVEDEPAALGDGICLGMSLSRGGVGDCWRWDCPACCDVVDGVDLPSYDRNANGSRSDCRLFQLLDVSRSNALAKSTASSSSSSSSRGPVAS